MNASPEFDDSCYPWAIQDVIVPGEGTLSTIVADKWQAVQHKKQRIPLHTFLENCQPCHPAFPLELALQHPTQQPYRLILEIKPSSPSAGVLQHSLNSDSPDLSAIINAYNTVAMAISVLTDEQYFGGSLDLLRCVVKQTSRPVLCKDFIIDPYQLYEARMAGASVALLIVKSLTPYSLARLTQTCRLLGMTPLIEIQNTAELACALAVNPTVLLINNRDLQTLSIDLNTTQQLAPLIPEGIYKLSASGIQTHEEVKAIAPFCDGFLIGSTLMKEPIATLPQKLQQLMNGYSVLTTPQIKVCGLTSLEDAEAAIEAGATMLGFIFVPASPRSVTPEVAEAIINSLRQHDKPKQYSVVGVFQNQEPEWINTVARQCHLDIIQLHGEEPVLWCKQITQPVLRVITLNPVEDETAWADQLSQVKAFYSPLLQHNIVAFLIDLPKQQRSHSATSSHSQAKWLVNQQQLIKTFCQSYPVILAGGITPENVAEVLDCFAPLGIDVASGIEAAPGKKVLSRMRLFCQTASRILNKK
jgi:indole-3-glycerol phosphate synthase / phosphoribosylanthranilate isomerase